jgi:hypothetical protein
MRFLFVFVTALLLVVVPAAQGEVLVYEGSLSGAAENPPTPSLGSGTALISYDTTAHTLLVVFDFNDLTGTTTAAHIHCCVAPPGNAGVASQTPFFPGFPTGVTSGAYTSTPAFDLTNPASFNPTFVADNGGTAAGAEAALAAGLAAGQAYLNIHTTAFPGGEIRTFLTLATPVQLQRLTID